MLFGNIVSNLVDPPPPFAEYGTRFARRVLTPKLLFKYYVSILGGGGGSEAMLNCLFWGEVGGPEFGKSCLYNT